MRFPEKRVAMPVNRDRLWAHVSVLCEEIGPRLSGTPADERTVAYIGGHFRRCGTQVEVQDFPCPGWEHQATELTLLATSGPESLPAFAQTFTEACDVEAELVGVSTWYELELALDLEGKVLMLYGEAASNLAADHNPTLLSAEGRRPSAVIVIGSSETVSTKLIRDPFLRVPAVAVSHSVGLRLRENEGRRVRLRMLARRYDSIGHNIIGRLPGAGLGHIVVAAHYDTAASSPGATDNASGTAVVLELCELFAATDKRQLGIDFIAYGAEEYGRHGGNLGGNLGSVEYVRCHPVKTQEACAVVEADCIGTVAVPPRVRVMGWSAPQRQGILDVLQPFPRFIVDVRPETEAPRTALHLPGVPVLAFVNDYGKLPIHTAQDTIDLMSPDEMGFSAQVIAAVVDHLCSGLTPKKG
ncbi:M28 family peptidase [Candidatus Poribacteria bacterium]|nr:M28 family peptidase [Candidatus Poribacteria bacterium]